MSLGGWVLEKIIWWTIVYSDFSIIQYFYHNRFSLWCNKVTLCFFFKDMPNSVFSILMYTIFFYCAWISNMAYYGIVVFIFVCGCMCMLVSMPICPCVCNVYVWVLAHTLMWKLEVDTWCLCHFSPYFWDKALTLTLEHDQFTWSDWSASPWDLPPLPPQPWDHERVTIPISFTWLLGFERRVSCSSSKHLNEWIIFLTPWD